MRRVDRQKCSGKCTKVTVAMRMESLTTLLKGINKTRKVLDVDTQFKSPDLVDAFLFWYNGI